MRKILNTIGKQYTPKAKTILEKIGKTDYRNINQRELLRVIGRYDIVLVGLGLNIDKDVIENGDALKIIATATTGLDHIDTRHARKKSIEILSLKGENDFLNSITGTAELAFGLLIDLLRFMSHSFADVKAGRWDRERWRGHNVCGQTLGVVGAGRLGRWMMRYGNAFGMNVVFYDPHVEKNEEAKKVDFETLLRKSDAVSIHVHLSPETENMFNGDVFRKMKKMAVLINTSRGKIVNESDLLVALQGRVIAGYAADVLTDELNFKDNIFEKHPLVEYAKIHTNCIVVPHIGGMTHESREATDIFIAEKIRQYVNTHGFK